MPYALATPKARKAWSGRAILLSELSSWRIANLDTNWAVAENRSEAREDFIAREFQYNREDPAIAIVVPAGDFLVFLEDGPWATFMVKFDTFFGTRTGGTDRVNASDTQALYAWVHMFNRLGTMIAARTGARNEDATQLFLGWAA